MVYSIPTQKAKIVTVLNKNPKGLSRGEIGQEFPFSFNHKTLQRRLSSLVDEGQIKRTGNRKTARYWPSNTSIQEDKEQKVPMSKEIFSERSKNILKFLETPHLFREKVSYKRNYIERYVPNETVYVPKDFREALLAKGRRYENNPAAGTYARYICQRFLIDLTYNSSRLEGNSYSRFDTQKLVDDNYFADGKKLEETVMILNHKEAILFLVEYAHVIEFNNFTIFNLHNLLSQDLIANPQARGKIRQIEVSIGQSAYHPLGNGHVLKELFELILLKARSIQDPFEQSFFILVHLSYLQGFVDVNKRTSRLACNIPFITHNLCPLSFTDVPRDAYIKALLAIYEKNEIQPMLDLFGWAYFQSCQQYDVVKETLGELDRFRIKTRSLRKEVMGQVIREGIKGMAIENHIKKFCQQHSIPESDKFVAITLTELSSLHEGETVGLGVSVEQLNSWLYHTPD